MAFATAQKSTRYCHPPPPTSGVLTCCSSESSVKGHMFELLKGGIAELVWQETIIPLHFIFCKIEAHLLRFNGQRAKAV